MVFWSILCWGLLQCAILGFLVFPFSYWTCHGFHILDSGPFSPLMIHPSHHYHCFGSHFMASFFSMSNESVVLSIFNQENDLIESHFLCPFQTLGSGPDPSSRFQLLRLTTPVFLPPCLTTSVASPSWVALLFCLFFPLLQLALFQDLCLPFEIYISLIIPILVATKFPWVPVPQD